MSDSTERKADTAAESVAAAIYLAAAREIESHQYDVPLPLAVRRAEGIGIMDESPLMKKVKEVFLEPEGLVLWPWTAEKNRRDLRVLVLCFMAAMVEAGDA